MPPLFFHSSAKASQQAASRRILLIVALCLFIVALALVIIQSIPSSRLVKTYADGYADGFNKARDFAKTQAPSLRQTRGISGAVTAKSADGFTVVDQGLFVDEQVDGIGNERTIRVTQDTKIVRATERSPEDFEKAQAEFSAALATFNPRVNSAPPSPPLLYTETPITLDDISVGDRAFITPADENLDLLLTPSFAAARIVIMASK